MVKTLSAGDVIKVLSRGDEAVASANQTLGEHAEILPANFGDIWLRDTGPIFAATADGVIALRFANNGWDGKYSLPGDDRVGDVVAQAAGAAIARFDFVLEGGALEHNGVGSILTTRQCLLHANQTGHAEYPAGGRRHDLFVTR